MRLPVVQEEESDVSRITCWLEEVPLANEEEEEGVEPATPRRGIIGTAGNFQQVSPTDTSFSGASVFDNQDSSSSPCPGGRSRFPDNGSDATSVDDGDDDAHKPSVEKSVHPLAPENLHAHNVRSTTNDSLADHEHPTAPAPSQTHPRLTTILSCIQCTLLALPCSRTPPCCSRCMRNARTCAPPCLLVRPRFADELPTVPTRLRTRPVLLRRADESAAAWAEKMAVKARLLEGWRAGVERLNWVCPRIESERRGGWMGEGKGGGGVNGGEWEGVGRVVWWRGEVGEGMEEI
ncbi:hypothetical protein BDU57DRAFT_530595 [Ampelomyces quisqualis]|uniref:Uncharacterized protein n=1 Tax=Ampelomyces quisqualis TaxID=50730 RepID=A0A6A5QJN4_AMPQU|nr:hypothetical protein BDU57DRAFT_530595 [Ampelomyces quisqualis]